MQKTLDALNTVWSGRKAEVKVASNKNVTGTIDRFDWVINEDTYTKGIVYLKVTFLSLENPASTSDPKEYLININDFAINRI